MNPRGFLLGLSFAATLITGAFFMRDNFNTVVALLNSPLQIQTASPATAPIVEQI